MGLFGHETAGLARLVYYQVAGNIKRSTCQFIKNNYYYFCRFWKEI